MKVKRILSLIISLAMFTSMFVTMTTVSALSITEQAYWKVESGKNEPAIKDGKMELVAGDSAMLVLKNVPNIGEFNAESTYTIEFDAIVTEATAHTRTLYVAPGAYWNNIEIFAGKIRTGDVWNEAINTVNQDWHYKVEQSNTTITSTITDSKGNVVLTGYRTNDAYATLSEYSLRCESGAITVDNVKVSKDGVVLLTDTFEIPEAVETTYMLPSITEQAYWEVESGKREPAVEGGKMKLVSGESAMLVLANVPNIGLFKENNAYTIEFDATVTEATSNSDNALYIGTNAWYNQIQVFMGKLRAGDTWNESINTVNQNWHYKIELADGKVTSTITDSDGNVVLTGYRTSGYSDGLAKYSLRCANGAVTVDNVKVSKNGNALLIDEFNEKNTIYTTTNGWTLIANSTTGKIPTEQEDGTLKLEGKSHAQYKPDLDSTKKYEITYDVTGLATGGSFWDQDFRVKLISGDIAVDPIITHREAGKWVNDNGSVTTSESGVASTNKLVVDMTTGAWESYADDVLCMTGTIASTDELIFEFYSWTATEPSIGNIQITELDANTIYTLENGWTLSVNSEGVSATELEDGSLQLNNSAIFKPEIETGKKYSIKYDVTGLEQDAANNAWTFPFRVKMSAGGTETDGILAYRMEGVWEARSLAVASATNGTNEIIIDTSAKTWEAYALGSLSTYGTVESFEDFSLTFYRWGGPSASISNVTVEEIIFDGTYYEQDFDGIEAAFSNWRAATVSEVRTTQPLQVWSGDFGSNGSNKYLLSNSMDIYPLAVTSKTGKYEVNFDIKPNAATDPNGSNWEGIVMQWNLGSSNSDSWHDMKIGTSQGADVAGTVSIDRLWIFGHEMEIDPMEWINVNLIYNCATRTIEATVKQGTTEVAASASFACDASALNGSPKIIFEGIARNEVKYAGVYLDNIEIVDIPAPILSNYQITSNGTVVDSFVGLSSFDVELSFKPEERMSGQITALVGVYDSEERLVASGYEAKTVKATDNSIVVNVSLDTPYTSENTCKVFVWDGELRPLFPVIYPTEK